MPCRLLAHVRHVDFCNGLSGGIWAAGMREMQEREVTLTDCHPDIMEALLQFCYTGECRRPKRDMLGLLVMADRLDMPCLTAICEKVRPLSWAARRLRAIAQNPRLHALQLLPCIF